MALILALGAVSVAGFLSGHPVTSYDPLQLDIHARLQPLSSAHWLGTDRIGRDLLARVIAGAWISLSVSACVLAVAGTFGTKIGWVAGYFGGLVDEVLMRLTDLFLAFPALILAAAVAASFGGAMIPTTIALAAVFWPCDARLIRARVLSLKQQD